jgi:hypothetical protein
LAIIEEGNAITSSRFRSPKNPILIADFELGSAKYPILIEDRDALPQSDVTEPESDNGVSADITPSAEDEEAVSRDFKAWTPQQNGSHFRED